MVSQGKKAEMGTVLQHKHYGNLYGNARREVFLTAFHHGFEKQIKKKQQQEKLSAHKLIDSDGDRGMWRFNLPHVWWQDIY